MKLIPNINVKRFAIPLLFSLVLHISFLIFAKFGPPSTPNYVNRNIIKISLLEPSIKKKEVVKKEDLEPKQIVDLPNDQNVDEPDDPKYLSESNHKTEKETVSRNRMPTDNPSHELLPDGPDQQTIIQEQQSKSDPVPLDEGKGPPRDLSKLKLIPDMKDILKTLPPPGKRGGAPSNDAIVGVEEGDGTFLNTKEFKYASFFNRIKRDISIRWHPAEEWKFQDPTGNLYGHIQKKTTVFVTLDKDGFIKHVAVSQSSNIDFLDAAAVRAFWDCKQFPNPPAGLIVNNKIEFYFGFVVNFNPKDIRNGRK